MYIPKLSTEFITIKRPPVNKNTQLAYVLSYHQFDLLPEKTMGIIKNKYSYIYPLEADFEWAFCRYFWESHVKLPEIPTHTIEEWDKNL